MITAWELRALLSAARARHGMLPWSICVEVSQPLTINGVTWEARRHRVRRDGQNAYGYTRSQVRAMIGALDAVLASEIARQAQAFRTAATDLGVRPDE